MFFSWAGRIIAILIFVTSTLKLLVALGFALSEQTEGTKAAINYIFGGRTTGYVIDRATYAILIAVALGILSEISFTLRRKS
jgi:hypothetical protein